MRVESWGCALFPHKTIWSNKVVCLPPSELVEIPDPDNTVIDNFGFIHETSDSCFGKESYSPAGVSLNDFLRIGYYTGGKKTNRFTDKEYAEFEAYAKKNPDIAGREDSRFKI